MTSRQRYKGQGIRERESDSLIIYMLADEYDQNTSGPELNFIQERGFKTFLLVFCLILSDL